MSADVTTPGAGHEPSPTVLILHPGAMGSAIGARLRTAGTRTCWVAEGRSAASVRRAQAAGLEAVPSLAQGLAQADVVLSVCPPHAAFAVAASVAKAGYRGIYVDANAISPDSTLRVGALVQDGGARFVDGGIIGPPPVAGAGARLYLSGAHAMAIAPLFDVSPLSAIVLDGPAGQASALKMAYAGWNKGTIALLASLRAFAARHGLDDALLAEWRGSDPEVIGRCARVAASAHKAWRWEAEMHEIADALAGAGLPDGFHRSAADVYARLHGFKDLRDAPTLDAINDPLLTRPPTTGPGD